MLLSRKSREFTQTDCADRDISLFSRTLRQ